MNDSEMQTGSNSSNQPQMNWDELAPEDVLGGYSHQTCSQLDFPLTLPTGNPTACLAQLINGAHPNEYEDLVKEIFSNQGEVTPNGLSKETAQSFIDIIGNSTVSLNVIPLASTQTPGVD